MLKLLFALLLVIGFSIKADAQYDILINKTFNKRYPTLINIFQKYQNAEDSVALDIELNKVEAIAVKKRDDKLLAEIMAIQLKRFQINKQVSRATVEANFNKALKLATKLNYTMLLATLNYYQADYYWTLNELTLSIQLYEKSLEYIENFSAGEYFLNQEIDFQVGMKYYSLTDYTTSIYYLNKSLHDVTNNGDNSPQIGIYNTLGLAFLNLGKIDSSEISFNHALNIAKATGSETWIGNLSGNLGHLYVLRGEIEKGESFLRTDMEYNLKRNLKGPAIGAMLELANLNFKKGKIDVAKSLIDSVYLVMGTKIPFNRKKILFPLLSKLYSYQGKWKESAIYMDSSIIVFDSLAKLGNVVQILRLKQLIELQTSRAELTVREARIRKKTLQIYGMVAGLLLTLFGGFLLYKQKKKTDIAKQKSDELLLNILPFEIANELKATGASQARKYTETSILFCDFQNFTQHSEALEPEKLVSILNDYFKAFDQVVTSYGLEKIKTVGDAYICASGLPNPDPEHAVKMVQCALEFQKIMNNSKVGWKLRIGIHSGPVVAGIVGIKKFAYDIWGDTVNTAARMEQNSEVGKVNISQQTYDLVKHIYKCTYRGQISAKNKGEMEMYYIEGLV